MDFGKNYSQHIVEKQRRVKTILECTEMESVVIDAGKIKFSKFSHPRKVYASITDTLEAYFQLTRRACEYRLSPLKSELYAIHSQEVEIAPEPPKRYDIYGDYE